MAGCQPYQSILQYGPFILARDIDASEEENKRLFSLFTDSHGQIRFFS